MKSLLISVLVYFAIGVLSVFSVISLSFLFLGEGNPTGAIALAIGLFFLLIFQAAALPTRLSLLGSSIGLAWGVILGAWFTAGFMQNSIMYVENYLMRASEIPVGGIVLSVISLILGWAAYGVAVLIQTRRLSTTGNETKS